jgi:hypothetical protein
VTLETQYSDEEIYIRILSKLNAMLVMKHGGLFNIEEKAPNWDWVINKLDEIITDYESHERR